MASIAGPCDDHVLGPRGSKAEFGASNRLGTPNSDRKPGVTFDRVRGDTYTREIPKHLPRYVRLKDYQKRALNSHDGAYILRGLLLVGVAVVTCFFHPKRRLSR
uniref:(northern house mosquito) hypothetical protein n=1 Tax=Culex pipiens TaxID=7175 RepID=A0A8D8HFG5_CULPI